MGTKRTVAERIVEAKAVLKIVRIEQEVPLAP